jgi:hypothetical protein
MNGSEPKKRFSRGRRPGVKLNEYGPRTNTHARPGLRRFSVSVPVELSRAIEGIKSELDLDYSKLFRKGLDHVVRIGRANGEISQKACDRYWNVRHAFKDDDLSGTE